MPAPAYIDSDTTLFKLTARVEGLPNRAILYRGNILHCAWLPDAARLTRDPHEGRLTLNMFLTGDNRLSTVSLPPQ